MSIVFNKNDEKMLKSKLNKHYQLKRQIKSLSFVFLSIIYFYLQLHGNITNKIHISINVDNKYIYTCLVYLTSLLDNRAESTYYIIHALTNHNLSKDSIDKIKAVIKKFGKNCSEILFYNLGDDFKGATIRSYFTLTTYYRIALPSILKNINKVIYTDIDMINLKDLTEMYQIKFNQNMYLFANLDNYCNIKELKKFGIKENKYINSGVLLMNLKAMRENSVEKKLRDFISTHYLRLHEQTAINAVCHNNIQILPYKYSIFALNSFKELVMINNNQKPKYRFNKSELYKAYHNPTLVHFFWKYKPWNKKYSGFHKVYWWYYAKMSGYYDEILKYYKQNINYVEDLLKKIPDDGGLLNENNKRFI